MIYQDNRPVSPLNCRMLLANEFRDENNVRFHVHDGAEMIFVESGSCTVELDSRRMKGEAGDLFFIPCGMRHNQINSGNVRDIYCVYRATPEWEKRTGVLQIGHDSLLRDWFSHLPLLAEHFALDQGGILLAAILTRIDFLEKNAGFLCDNDPAATARRFLDSHYEEHLLSLAMVAHAAGISISHLKTLFRKRFGMGVMQYAASLRMRRAEQLLRAPYGSIAEIAFRCGYTDPDYFARAFRLCHGFSPGMFRKNCRKNPEPENTAK